MKEIEEIINDLKGDSDELFHKERTKEEKAKLIIWMIVQTNNLKALLYKELSKVSPLDEIIKGDD